ncbi:hypothetical protein MESS2_290002 [Mesorhizobium metallidurans STM 2683]|uniref:Uncharacterized protein n=1 Tax=Mesorhizobium metallidurans STM 2683 TaxID=1297569 RepID=M5F2Y9_9HYPH|nr:hypothetical protein MESS2_290002 [Mesorhizobium metallidurans STM 2683]
MQHGIRLPGDRQYEPPRTDRHFNRARLNVREKEARVKRQSVQRAAAHAHAMAIPHDA